MAEGPYEYIAVTQFEYLAMQLFGDLPPHDVITPDNPAHQRILAAQRQRDIAEYEKEKQAKEERDKRTKEAKDRRDAKKAKKEGKLYKAPESTSRKLPELMDSDWEMDSEDEKFADALAELTINLANDKYTAGEVVELNKIVQADLKKLEGKIQRSKDEKNAKTNANVDKNANANVEKKTKKKRDKKCEGLRCLNKAKSRCGGCRKAYFCSTKCLHENWPEHQKNCVTG